ncbi:MAG: ISNCY family transposase [Acidobacteriota bacterium]
MRKMRETQTSLSYPWLELDHAKELQALSRLLDRHPKIAERVLQDLTHEGCQATGAHGASADLIFRALLLKQMHSWSYEELHFHLSDSQTYRAFCQIPLAQKAPGRSTLAAAIKKIQPQTLEAIHHLLLREAYRLEIETGQLTRVDCTVVRTLMHEPSDSQLLWDCIRVLGRGVKRARALLPAGSFKFSSRNKRAKRRCREIATARRKAARLAPYRDLVKVAEEVEGKAREAVQLLEKLSQKPETTQRLLREIEHYAALTRRVVDQTRRRVFQGESVPAQEKVVSIFEEHSDIIRKDFKDTYYGHKICLNVGKTSMVLDCQILRGNPADAKLALKAIERQQEILGQAPRQAVFDGAFASKANLEAIKDRGSQDVVFTKGRTLKVSDMAKSLWVYRKLRRFRAGVEGVISYLKRTFGLHRCTWRSWPSFQSYVWSSILASNLLIMARALCN